jgi:hypothetical protein
MVAYRTIAELSPRATNSAVRICGGVTGARAGWRAERCEADAADACRARGLAGVPPRQFSRGGLRRDIARQRRASGRAGVRTHGPGREKHGSFSRSRHGSNACVRRVARHGHPGLARSKDCTAQWIHGGRRSGGPGREFGRPLASSCLTVCRCSTSNIGYRRIELRQDIANRPCLEDELESRL